MAAAYIASRKTSHHVTESGLPIGQRHQSSDGSPIGAPHSAVCLSRHDRVVFVYIIDF